MDETSERISAPTIVAYAGGAAAHSAAAAEQLFPSPAELVAVSSFVEVVRAAVEREVGYGVLPIESSLVGPIAETHDLLWDSPLSIVAETAIPIRHHLVGRARVPLERVRVVRSHPAALEQCRKLLASLPQAKAIAAATTADAAAQVAESNDEGEVAIASERAARLHGLETIASDVGDHPEAYTRFVSLATHTRLDGPHGAWRTAFSFVTDHRAGALHDAIEPFARHRLDLVQLVSRPIPHSPWTYRFDAVLAAHPLETEAHRALAEVRSRVRRLRVFGSYPAGA
jgi:chorismate mutase/prephenate dehydratase